MVLSEQLCYVNWHLLWMVALPRLPSWSRKHISQSCTDSSYQSSVFSFVIWLVISRLSLLVLAKCHYLNIVFLFVFLVSTIKERKKNSKPPHRYIIKYSNWSSCLYLVWQFLSDLSELTLWGLEKFALQNLCWQIIWGLQLILDHFNG